MQDVLDAVLSRLGQLVEDYGPRLWDIYLASFSFGFNWLLPLIPDSDAREWASSVSVEAWAQALLAFCVLLVFVYVNARLKSMGYKRQQQQQTKKAEAPLRVRRQPWYRRFRIWRSRVFEQPWYWQLQEGHWWKLWRDRVVARLDQTHGLVTGGSGSGKSTLVVSLILQPCIGLYMLLMRKLGLWKRRKVVIVSFDRSDPIEEATNVLEDRGIPVNRWRVRQTNGWKLIDGDREMIAEALPLGWPQGDNTGFFQQLATDALSAALKEQDDLAIAQGMPEGATRDFDDMIARMDRIMDDDPETPDLARRTWVRRFKSLSRVMGESIGDDFDLAGILADPDNEGLVLHLSCNSYSNPALVPLVGAMAITQIKIAADKVPGSYVIFEEASFLKKRADLLDDLAKSLRARGWRILYLNQDPQNVGQALKINFGVAVFMGLGPLANEARNWCADVVKDFPGAFRAAEIVLGATLDALEGYVLLNGRCMDVSFPPYITRPAEHRPAASRPVQSRQDKPGSADVVSGFAPGHGGPGQVKVQVVEVKPVPSIYRFERINGAIALPPPVVRAPKWIVGRERREAIYKLHSGISFANRDWVFAGKGRNGAKGEYGKTSYYDKTWSTHALMYCMWVVQQERDGETSDLRRFLIEHPLIEFGWPSSLNDPLLARDKGWMLDKGLDVSHEDIQVFYLRRWMERWDVTVNHECPNTRNPNRLCGNAPRCLRMMVRRTNSYDRWDRINGVAPEERISA